MTTQDLDRKIQEAKELLREIEEQALIEFSSIRHRPERREVYRSGVFTARECHDSLERYRTALCAVPASQ